MTVISTPLKRMQSVQSDHDHLDTSYLPPEGEDVAHLGDQLIPTTA